MGLTKLLGTEYIPTAAFSFEFFKRNPTTKRFGLADQLGEIFFLLPPEEYSMTEGYRVSISKTAGGGWVDDFGNDFKQLRLSGSLYSYYTGYPVTSANIETGALGGMKNYVKKIGNDVLQQGKKLVEGVANEFGVSIPGLKGLSGLEEFFKLRYLVSRFRDVIVDDKGQKTTVAAPNIPELESIVDQVSGKALYDAIGIVYHDYDDNNHFEIVFTDFTMRKSKDDPFTINYVIEMTCMRMVDNMYLGEGKITQKESASAVLTEFRKTYNDILNDIQDIANIPNALINTYNALVQAGQDLYTDIERFADNVSTNWDEMVAKIEKIKEKNNEFEALLFSTLSGYVIELLKDETYQLNEGFINIQILLDKQREILSHMKGIEKYFSLEESEKTYIVDEKTLEENDFESDAEEKQDNVFTSKNRIYYLIRQGDTLSKLGYKFYGDYEKAIIIAEVNELKNSDFENEAMVGVTIVIPLEFRAPSRMLDNNLVYYKRLKQSTPRERQLQILGSDLRLNSNREIVADGTGDLSLIYGDECYMENINDRLRFKVGTLSPIHPNWGILLNVGNAPSSVAIMRILDNIENQALSDPRTQKAFIDREKVDLSADTLRIFLHTKPYSGSEQVIDAVKISAGLLV